MDSPLAGQARISDEPSIVARNKSKTTSRLSAYIPLLTRYKISKKNIAYIDRTPSPPKAVIEKISIKGCFTDYKQTGLSRHNYLSFAPVGVACKTCSQCR